MAPNAIHPVPHLRRRGRSPEILGSKENAPKKIIVRKREVRSSDDAVPTMRQCGHAAEPDHAARHAWLGALNRPVVFKWPLSKHVEA